MRTTLLPILLLALAGVAGCSARTAAGTGRVFAHFGRVLAEEVEEGSRNTAATWRDFIATCADDVFTAPGRLHESVFIITELSGAARAPGS